MHRLLVDVVQPRAGVVLAQRRLQLVEVGEVLQRAGSLTDAERLVTAHLRTPAPVEVGPPRTQRVAELLHLPSEVHVLERGVHQRRQLGALFGTQRLHQPLGRGSAAGQRVDELVEVLRVVREEVAVFRHERVELLLRVLPSRVRLQHRVEVAEHVLDPLQLLGVGILQGLLHPAELAVQDLPAQQVADLVVRRPRLGRPPVVGVELANRAGRVSWQRIQRRLPETRVVGRVREERGSLLAHRGVEQPAYLLQRAVEAAALAQVSALLPDAAQHLVQAAHRVRPTVHQRSQRVGRHRTGQHVVAHLVQGRAHVVRRGERIRTAVPCAVPVAPHHAAPPPLHHHCSACP